MMSSWLLHIKRKHSRCLRCKRLRCTHIPLFVVSNGEVCGKKTNPCGEDAICNQTNVNAICQCKAGFKRNQNTGHCEGNLYFILLVHHYKYNSIAIHCSASDTLFFFFFFFFIQGWRISSIFSTIEFESFVVDSVKVCKKMFSSGLIVTKNFSRTNKTRLEMLPLRADKPV